MSKSRFSELTQDPPIEVFELTRQFNEDTHPNKVNLGVGCNLVQIINVIFYYILYILLFFEALKKLTFLLKMYEMYDDLIKTLLLSSLNCFCYNAIFSSYSCQC